MTDIAQPRLVALLGGHHTAAITDAFFVPEAGALVSASMDKQILVWLKRDDSTYWPSVHRTMPAPISLLCFEESERRLFIGLENGAISEYELSQDYNVLTSVKGYPAHTSTVTGMCYDRERQLLISCSRDKTMTLSSTTGTGKRLASLAVSAACTALQYDATTQTTFVGDYKGEISVFKLENNKFLHVAGPLVGHSGSIRTLEWVPEKQWLFSGSFDKTVILWDIGGHKGERFELRAHRRTVTSLTYIHENNALLSLSSDGLLALWDMTATREPCADWEESDSCQICNDDFFWHVSGMWHRKSISIKRQHHCRVCGKAVCDDCSRLRCTYPIQGYEYAVRVCKNCAQKVQESDRTPLAKRFPSTATPTRTRFEGKTTTLVMCCEDASVKLVDLSPVLAENAQGLAQDADIAAVTGPSQKQSAAMLNRHLDAPTSKAGKSGKPVTAVVDMTTKALSDNEDDDDDGQDFFKSITAADDDEAFHH
eukprot:m.17479 g.17479  ORF g.17479 m.17479 type:complete len:482 (+) comp8293_c0_seq1:223-1668(+)